MTAGPHVLIVQARFYQDIADQLVRGATQALEERGASYETLAVPGAFEIPAAIALARSAGGAARRFDGYIALGCVIRGETTHYNYVCTESARKLQDLACDHGLPLGFGILTCETHEQARVRADVAQKNKGRDAALACLRMHELKQLLAANGGSA